MQNAVRNGNMSQTHTDTDISSAIRETRITINSVFQSECNYIAVNSLWKDFLNDSCYNQSNAGITHRFPSDSCKEIICVQFNVHCETQLSSFFPARQFSREKKKTTQPGKQNASVLFSMQFYFFIIEKESLTEHKRKSGETLILFFTVFFIFIQRL